MGQFAVAGIGGMKQLRRRIRAVGRDLPSKVLTPAARKAANEIVPVAKRLAPVGETGRLRASIRVLASQRRAAVAAGHYATGARGSATHSRRAFYARMVHEGTGRRRNRSGANRGAVTARPFLDDALDEVTVRRVRHVYETELRDLMVRHRVI